MSPTAATPHDGFTLRDLVSYNDKHNEDNGEDNRDGTDDNRSWNCGVEGDTDDQEILALRARQQRNFIATLMVSQGTPMLLGGDERSRSQSGNNNPWCQDNEISWFDWDWTELAEDIHAFTRRAIKMRLSHPVFRRESFLVGSNLNDDTTDDPADADLADGWWFRPDGEKMTPAEWDGDCRAFGLFLNGEAIPNLGPQGQRITDDSFLLMFNACPDNIDFTLPRRYTEMRWAVELSTMAPGALPGSTVYDASQPVSLIHRSLLILKRVA
jgi:isoamylase